MAKVLLVVIVLALFVGGAQIRAFAEGEGQSKSVKQYYDEFYNEKNGFMSVGEAVRIFEGKYKKEVELPAVFPSKVIMQKAEIVPSPDQKGIAVKVYYLAERARDTLIVYIDNESPHGYRFGDEQVVLDDGTKANFRNTMGFYFLEFRKNGLRYVFGVSTDTTTDISVELMRQIGNSMLQSMLSVENRWPLLSAKLDYFLPVTYQLYWGRKN